MYVGSSDIQGVPEVHLDPGYRVVRGLPWEVRNRVRKKDNRGERWKRWRGRMESGQNMWRIFADCCSRWPLASSCSIFATFTLEYKSNIRVNV